MTRTIQVIPAEARDYQGQTAGIVTRVAANAIDLAVAAGIVAGLYVVWAATLFLLRGRNFTFPTVPWGAAIVALFVVLAASFTLAWATSGRTYGDHVLGLRVVTGDGDGLGRARSLIRALLCVPFPFLLFWAAVARERRSVQDILVGTKVIYDWQPDRQTTRSARA